MWAELKKLLHDCLTENNGTTYCPFRVSGFVLNAMSFPTFIGSTIYTVIHNHTFDMTAFGMSHAAILAGCAALAGGVALKARTDLPAQPEE
jgi:hypothetical protein